MTNYTRIAGLVIAAVTLTTTPALAQRNRRDGGGTGGKARNGPSPRANLSARGLTFNAAIGARRSAQLRRSPPALCLQLSALRVSGAVRIPPLRLRPGWNLGLYFGAPYSAYGYPGYGYGPSAGYGYYSLVPGRAYGAVRIVDAPRDAQVLVDGYYAGVVDDYDGVFQHLNLEAGAHRIEIQIPGGPPISFDVRVRPGETVTYHAFSDQQ